VRGLGRIKKIYRLLSRRLKPRAVILMYHRVAELSNDPYGLAVSPTNFAQHLKYIQDMCHPMRLPDLVDALQQNLLPKRAVAVTFDDGYADNFCNAYPILSSEKIPATIFVATGYLNGSIEFWWDELERYLLAPKQAAPSKQIQMQGQIDERPNSTPEQKIIAHQSIQQLLKPMSQSARDEVLDVLALWAGQGREERPDYRPMTTNELIQITQNGLIEIGAHTISHPVLSKLPLEVQFEEIIGSRQRLEGITESSVITFAYPYGTSEDYSDKTVEILKATGFHAACTTTHGSIGMGDDPFRLRRCAVRNWEIDSFKRHLEDFFVF
jgi:peptidoglycan/xylan/chitin deacetylase (PgdA/CDA1 family)